MARAFFAAAFLAFLAACSGGAQSGPASNVLPVSAPATAPVSSGGAAPVNATATAHFSITIEQVHTVQVVVTDNTVIGPGLNRTPYSVQQFTSREGVDTQSEKMTGKRTGSAHMLSRICDDHAA